MKYSGMLSILGALYSPKTIREFHLYGSMDKLAKDIHLSTGLDKEQSISASKIIGQINAIGKGKNCIEYLQIKNIEMIHGWNLDSFIDPATHLNIN